MFPVLLRASIQTGIERIILCVFPVLGEWEINDNENCLVMTELGYCDNSYRRISNSSSSGFQFVLISSNGCMIGREE